MSLSKTDRTVHAAYPGMEIVRYDRSGKWYLEPTDARLKRQRVWVRDAVKAAVWGLENGGHTNLDRPGGATFDRLMDEAVNGPRR